MRVEVEVEVEESYTFQPLTGFWSGIVMLLSEKNTLATLMSSISKEMQLSYQYTNYCIRVNAVSLLDECNFEARHIMRVSGHKS